MGIQLTDTMVRGLKGAPSTILLFFLIRIINGQTENVTQKYIQQMSGYSDKTTEDALLYLFKSGLVVRNDRYNWGLAGDINQLPLMAALMGENGSDERGACENLESNTLEPIKVVEIQDDINEELNRTRNNSVSGKSFEDAENFRVPEQNKPELTGTRKNSVSEEDVENTEKIRVVEQNDPDFIGTRKNSVLDTEIIRVDCPSSNNRYINNLDKEIRLLLLKLDDTEKIRVVENMQTCDEYGLYEPARTKLSLLKTTTPQLIKYHCETLKDSDTLGLAIHRIEHNQRISQKWVREQQYKAMFSSEEEVQNWNNLYSKSDISQEDFKKVLEAISLDFNKASFETWLVPLEVIEVSADEWTVSASNSYGGKWVVDHAAEKMEAAAGVKIKIVCNGTVID